MRNGLLFWIRNKQRYMFSNCSKYAYSASYPLFSAFTYSGLFTSILYPLRIPSTWFFSIQVQHIFHVF